MLSADNPETDEINYTYNSDGSLATIADERTVGESNVETSFTYDALGRVKTKSFNDSTPDVTYSYYTSGSPNIGRLLSVASSAATETFNGYDTLGRVTSHTQTITGNSNAYTLAYTFRLDDSIATMTYPSGRVIEYDVDDASRTELVSDGTTDYLTASGSDYDALGRLAAMELGNGLYESRLYRPAGTATALKLGTSAGGSQRLSLEYNYPATANNGNLTSHVITHSGPTTYTQSFSYDAVNRISSATESSGFDIDYHYDLYGNRWIDPNSTGVDPGLYEPNYSTNFDAKNQINVGNADHDAAGNQIYFAHYDLTFDAENRMTSAISDQNDDEAYFAYDGSGLRVGKSWDPDGGSQVLTYYVYDIAGRMVAEYSDETLPSAETSYIFADLLGSVRMVTDESGSVDECYDYLPFGRMLTTSENGRSSVGCYPSSPSAYTSDLDEKFTSQKRDETRLDYFLARYYADGQGRFLASDPLYGRVLDPQSWNRYAYARNNPLLYTDPSGLEYSIYYTDPETMTESLVKHISGLHEDLNYLSYAFQAAAYGYRFPDMHGSGPGCNVNDMNDCYRISYQAPSDFAGYPSDNADTIDRLLDTLPVAIDMILEPKCRLLFGAPSADLFSVWIQLRVGPIRAEGNPNIGALNARTAPVGAVLAGGERTSGFEITFNNSGFTDFNRERNPRIRAITVIHEFGHGWAYPNLGLGGSAIAPDGGDPGASRANFGLARDACL